MAKGNAQFIFLCNPQKPTFNVCLMKIIKKHCHKKKQLYIFITLIKKTFKSRSSCNISNFHYRFVVVTFKIYSFIFLKLKNCFYKYDDVIVTSGFVVQVLEMGILRFSESILSETIINRQTFLAKKSRKIWTRDPSRMVTRLGCVQRQLKGIFQSEFRNSNKILTIIILTY